MSDAPDRPRLRVRKASHGSTREAGETGIVVAGRSADGHAYVIEDATARGAPAETSDVSRSWLRRSVARVRCGQIRRRSVRNGPVVDQRSVSVAHSYHQHVSGNQGPDDHPASCAAVHSGVPSISDGDVVCAPPTSAGIASPAEVREVSAPPLPHAVATSSAKATSVHVCRPVLI
jgi:hypothetical protein